MKRFTLLSLALLSYFGLQAQSQFKFEVLPTVKKDTLILDYFVQKLSGVDFPLGSCNLAVNLNNSAVDVTKAVLAAPPARTFDAMSDPNSYLSMDKGVNGFVNINIRRFTAGTGTGALVDSSKKFIARLLVPITNSCDVSKVEWFTRPLGITDFSGTDIKSAATFQNVSTAFSLCEMPSAPVVQAAGLTTFCRGGNVVLDAGIASAVWYRDGIATGNVGQFLTAAQEGEYTAQVATCATCVSPLSQKITVVVKDAPVQPVTNFVNGILTIAKPKDGTVQWYLNGNPINGATDTSFTPTTQGTYTVGVKNDCDEVFSTPFSVTSTSSLLAGLEFTAFPNPFTTSTQVSVNLPKEGKVRIEAMNILSQEVNVLMEGNKAAGTHILDIKAGELGWSSGVYVLTLRYENQVKNLQLVYSK